MAPSAVRSLVTPMVILIVLTSIILFGEACGPEVKDPGIEILNPTPPTPETTRFVVLLVPGEDTDSAGRSEAAFALVVRSAFEAGAHLTLLRTRGSSEVEIVFSALTVVDNAPDGNDFAVKQLQKTHANVMMTAFRGAQAGPAGPAVDLLAVLNTLRTELHRGPGGLEALIVAPSAELHSTSIDTVVSPSFLDDPAATAASLGKTNNLPDLAGFGIAFLLPRSDSYNRDQALAAVWWNIVESAGGELTGFQSNVAEWPLAPIAEPRVPAVVEIPSSGSSVEDQVVLRVRGAVLFDHDSAQLRADAVPVIEEVARLLREHPGARIIARAYTDATGTAEYNQALSEARAQSLVEALVSAGVDQERLSAEGRGASDFVAPNDTEEGRQQNRRVEIVILGR